MDGEAGKISTQLVDLTAFTPELDCGFCGGRIDGVALSQELLTDEERQAREAAAREALERGEDPDMYWRHNRQFHTVGYLTTVAGALAAGYAEGWLTGALQFPPLEFSVRHRKGALWSSRATSRQLDWMRVARSTADGETLASPYRNVVRPPHWTRRGLLSCIAESLPLQTTIASPCSIGAILMGSVERDSYNVPVFQYSCCVRWR